MAKAKADQLADTLSTPTPRVAAIPDEAMLSTGCTVLNMAFSGRPDHAVPKGTYLYLVGDSGSSKTWLTFMLFAEAARNKHFSKYRFVHDNAENGALMNVQQYFGQGVLDRLEPPSPKVRGSTTAQEFYHHVEMNVDKGPCIYVLDSMDALRDITDLENFEAEQHYFETGKGKDKIKGTMGMAKAKTNSRNIAYTANVTLRTNGSILAVISQTRDKLGSTIPGLKTRAGGHALKFFAHLELWTKIKAPLTRYYAGKDREIGALIAGDVQKNRVNGWHGKVPLITFLSGYGVDDVGTSVDYLLDEKHWKKPKDAPEQAKSRRASADDEEDTGKLFAAPEFDFVGSKEELVKLIQDTGREPELAQVVAATWRRIAAGAAPQRKARYT